MARRESARLLQGVVLADDAVLGGMHSGKPWRGSENKSVFVAAVELNEERHPLHARFDAVDNLKSETLALWAKAALHPTVHLVTDGLASFSGAGARSPATARSSSGSASPASWSRSVGSTPSSPTPRPRSEASVITSISPSTATATSPRRSTGSTAALTWPRWLAGSCTPAPTPSRVRRSGSEPARLRPAEE